MKLIKTTANSWFIQEDRKTVGILYKKNEGYLFVSPAEKLIFADFKEVEKHFGKLKVSDKRANNSVKLEIGGYPVRHEQMFQVQEESKPFYSPADGGKSRYYAGFWALKFNNSHKYQVVLCPKVKTIEEHDGVGPFKSRLECLNESNIMNYQLKMKAG